MDEVDFGGAGQVIWKKTQQKMSHWYFCRYIGTVGSEKSGLVIPDIGCLSSAVSVKEEEINFLLIPDRQSRFCGRQGSSFSNLPLYISNAET